MKATFWQPWGIAILICAACIAHVWAQDAPGDSQSSSSEPRSTSTSRVSRAPAKSTLGQRTDQADSSDATPANGSAGQRVARSTAIRRAYVGGSSATDEAESATQSNPNADWRAAPPAPLSSPADYLASVGETEHRNVIAGSVSFATIYTDKSLVGDSSNPIAEFSYSIRPEINLDELWSRLRLKLSYSPGFTFYQRTSARNGAEHDLNLDVVYRLTPHLSFRVLDAFSKTSNLLAQIDSTTTQDFGLIKPNQSFIAPLANQTSNVTGAEARYQLSPRSMVGTRGTFSLLHYSTLNGLSGISDNSTQAAETFYSYRLSQRNYLGATYRYQQLTFDPNVEHTVTHSILLSYTINLRSAAQAQLHGDAREGELANPSSGSPMTLSIFAGPEHSDTSGPSLPPLRMWSPAAGFSFRWGGVHTRFSADLVHRIADGGGLQGSVRLTTASAGIRHQLARATELSFGGSCSNNALLDSIKKGGYTVLGKVAVEQRFLDRIRLKVVYAREHQTYANVQPGNGNGDQNVPSITLSYSFAKALGN